MHTINVVVPKRNKNIFQSSSALKTTLCRAQVGSKQLHSLNIFLQLPLQSFNREIQLRNHLQNHREEEGPEPPTSASRNSIPDQRAKLLLKSPGASGRDRPLPPPHLTPTASAHSPGSQTARPSAGSCQNKPKLHHLTAETSLLQLLVFIGSPHDGKGSD